MPVNYLDTVTMYHVCRCGMEKLFTAHWVWDDTSDSPQFHHYFIQAGYVYIRYFPYLYGRRYLYVTFSLPKMYRGCNDNTFNINGYDDNTFMDKLNGALSTVMDISQYPVPLPGWQPSRLDLFRIRAIKPSDRMEYMYGYSRLTYRGKRAHQYKNTGYLPSSESTHSSVILRSYNKTVEQQDKRSMFSGNLPAKVEKQHGAITGCTEMSPELYRYEFSLRRSALKRFCDKHGLPLDMETFMREDVQKIYLNELAQSRGLFLDILSKKDYRDMAKEIFPRQATYKSALALAESIRNNKPFPLKDHQRYRIQNKLKACNASTATTNFVTVMGIDRL